MLIHVNQLFSPFDHLINFPITQFLTPEFDNTDTEFDFEKRANFRGMSYSRGANELFLLAH